MLSEIYISYCYLYYGEKSLRIKILFLLFLTSVFSIASADTPKNFTEAKKIARKIFSDHKITIYCGCKYDKHYKIKHKSCGMTPTKDKKRAMRVEWEHIVPMYNVVRQRPCGQAKICKKRNGKSYGGRKCCQKIDKEFRQIEGELFNLWPSVGSVNKARSNYRFQALTSSDDPNRNNLFNYDGCEILIDSKNRAVEPKDAVKGVVARASLFMIEKYKVNFSSQQQKLYEVWNKQYPPSEWEKTWEKRVFAIQGYHNNYIYEYDY